MAEYIQRETLLERAEYDNNYRLIIPLEAIKAAPAADVAPVVHGQWIYDKKAQRPYCSVCKGYFYGATNSPMSYCPNCGTKMDGSKA